MRKRREECKSGERNGEEKCEEKGRKCGSGKRKKEKGMTRRGVEEREVSRRGGGREEGEKEEATD